MLSSQPCRMCVCPARDAKCRSWISRVRFAARLVDTSLPNNAFTMFDANEGRGNTREKRGECFRIVIRRIDLYLSVDLDETLESV